MSAARTSTSQSTVSRSVASTAVVRIGSRSSNGLLESAEEKLTKLQSVADVDVDSFSDITPKKGGTIVTVNVELEVTNGVEKREIEDEASGVVGIKSLRIDD